jgi:hypothetical protein
MKNLLSNLKALQTGTHKIEVGAGAGAKANSFGSATLFSPILANPNCDI